MSSVLTFSRTFPAYHPKAGQSTLFVQQIWQSIGLPSAEYYLNFENDVWWGYRMKGNPKHHTIRAGNRWKVGDKFSPRVWSGKPYASKQIIIAPDIEVKKVWSFGIENGRILINEDEVYNCNLLCNQQIKTNKYFSLASNDGLHADDFEAWFKVGYNTNNEKDFKGQIICWNENINY